MSLDALWNGENMKTEIESKSLLAKYGITTTNPQLATVAAEAVALVGRVAKPCALKVVSPDIAHKVAAGGVMLSVTTDSAEAAFDAIVANCRRTNPGARIDGVLVEEMIEHGLEVFIGARVDPQYGTVILLGPGGSNVEQGQKPTAALAPLTPDLADEMIDAAFPGAFDGDMAFSRKTLKDYVMAVAGANGLMMKEAIGELDINPIIINGAGAIAVDAVCDDLPDALGARRMSQADVDAALDARRARLNDLDALFDPASIAFVGASTQKEKLGYRVIRNMLDFGFKGDIYPIHPAAEEICGLKAYKSVSDVPGKVDRAYVAVASHQVPDVLRDCREKGVRVAQVLTAGFSEYSSESGDIEQRMLHEVRTGGMRMVGPNCMGTFSAAARIPLAAPRYCPTEPGGITFFSQSGTFAGDVNRRAQVMGLPLGRVLSCGNCADMDLLDYLLYADRDPNTEIVAFYVESLAEPGLFFRAAQGMNKPVVMLRGGTTEQGLTAASSHTAALATDSALWQAGLDQSGVLQVDTIDELMDALLVLTAHRSLAGNRLGIFGSGGGVSVTSSDAAARVNMAIPQLDATTQEGLQRFGVPGTSVSNPIDIPVWGLREKGRYILEEIINLLKLDQNVDGIIVYVEMGSIMDFADSDEDGLGQLREICASIARARLDGPAISLALRSSGDKLQDDFVRDQRVNLLEHGIAVFASTGRAVLAQSMLLRASKRRR
ncbi:acetate--CoA ligase family protein [Hoeflea sp. G2-23]|uniref:Acetate--CoA ligase family protein n=1 Tax=Hoeflea algicola TaxID=2983763 RepID=A0ABT3ZEA1_9HYPH|nr:acetate--CoA ligase family protein [Hoeflea algicola]MCY0149629.1 acetate--CoA ligase family protein [Hoeflea algicola]